MLTWAPLSAWRSLAGILLLLTAGILRKAGIIREGGFDLLLSIGLGMLGWGLTVAQVKTAQRERENGKGEGES